jgi:hypothetical protein
MLENTEWAIKNEQSREIGNTGHTRQRQIKQKHNTIYTENVYQSRLKWMCIITKMNVKTKLNRNHDGDRHVE